jgi:hypothetical protein
VRDARERQPAEDRERDATGYVRHRPEETDLYALVACHLETFLARQFDRERSVPRFVERELRAFLACGILAHGFVRVHCDRCGKDRVVAFSCKGRGVCPSCGGRRMAETAAHLVDHVFPEVPTRQWVLSLPMALRYRLAYDPTAVRALLGIFVRAVFGSLRRRARSDLGLRGVRCGAVTFVQRFGGALNLNVHFHTLAIDGVYAAERSRGPFAARPFDDPAGSRPDFHALPPPDDEEVARVTMRVARGLARWIRRQGPDVEADPDEADPLREAEPLLADVYAASIHGRIATGPRAGRRILRLGDRIDAEDAAVPAGPRCAAVAGVSVHADVAVPARDRQRLERLCRYVARPAISNERLSVRSDGLVQFELRRPWRDGTTHVLFEPLEFMEKLAALVPRPRVHLVRYHGVLAPAARIRAQVVPSCTGNAVSHPSHDACAGSGRPAGAIAGAPDPLAAAAPSTAGLRPRNYTWAELMHRVFELDVLLCPRCQGRMRLLATIQTPAAIRAILDCLGLPARPPPIAAAADEMLPGRARVSAPSPLSN